MRTGILFFLALIVSGKAMAQNPPAYEWFNADGKKTSFGKLVKATENADIVLFGELHDDPIAHWFQLVLAQRMYALDSGLVLGAEMMERDQQKALDRYVSGATSWENFRDSNKLWSNFETDYLPVVNFAKAHGLSFIATNIPRRYASMVFKKGLASLDTLSGNQKDYIVPLPFPMDTTLSQYRELIQMGMDMHTSGLDFAYAQAIKDATMAYSMLQYGGRPVLHLNGSYHSDFYQGIMWYLLNARPDLKIVTISTVTQASLKKLEADYKGKADFILVVPEGMTRTM